MSAHRTRWWETLTWTDITITAIGVVLVLMLILLALGVRHPIPVD